VQESVIDLLRLSRGALEMFESTQKRLVRELLAAPAMAQRSQRLMTIPAPHQGLAHICFFMRHCKSAAPSRRAFRRVGIDADSIRWFVSREVRLFCADPCSAPM
jgi:hypothetical protein